EVDAKIFVDGENLRIDSRKGAIDEKLRTLIKTHKESLINYVRQARSSDHLVVPQIKLQSSYQLSSAQRRLWVLSQLKEGNTAYNMTGVFVLEGLLDEAGLRWSFDELIGRHEI